MLLTKPLTDYFRRVSDKDAFFAPKRLKMAFASGVVAYGVTFGCGYKMVGEITHGDDWSASDLLSVNALRHGGPWGIAMVGMSYVGDVALIYAIAGMLHRRRNPAPTTP